ncbi:MAG: ABC transporter permease [Anaerolineales bacterium]|nr:ABC transporter permease [Anaerolineales bacterium]
MPDHTLKRLWIIFRTEFLAWRRDPITALGGVIPPTFILIAFGLLFGGKLLFPIAVINKDSGPYGKILVDAITRVESPFGIPYYEIVETDPTAAWDDYQHYRIEGIWEIPADFSSRIASGNSPRINMYFNNYIDDRAKNHRLYAAEILWAFYEDIGMQDPPLLLGEVYPADTMVHWFPVIGVGVVLMSAMLGGIFNMYALTYKESRSGLMVEAALMTRSVLYLLIPKTILSILFSLATGTIMLGVLSLWLGVWPGGLLWLTLLLMAVVAVFWVSISLLVGLSIRDYMAGAIGVALSGILVFFIGGGLNFVRTNTEKVIKIAWLFPNTYLVDPMRDLILFKQIPADLFSILLIACSLSFGVLFLCWGLAGHIIRRKVS